MNTVLTPLYREGEYKIDQRGVVVERAAIIGDYGGMKCSWCAYGGYVYRELHNRDGTAESICTKYRPVESTCIQSAHDRVVYKEVKHE